MCNRSRYHGFMDPSPASPPRAWKWKVEPETSLCMQDGVGFATEMSELINAGRLAPANNWMQDKASSDLRLVIEFEDRCWRERMLARICLMPLDGFVISQDSNDGDEGRDHQRNSAYAGQARSREWYLVHMQGENMGWYLLRANVSFMPAPLLRICY